MEAAYITYRIAAWRFVNWIIHHAEQTQEVCLDEPTRKTAQGYVINWVIEFTQLPVDLTPCTIPIQESGLAFSRLQKLEQIYRSGT